MRVCVDFRSASVIGAAAKSITLGIRLHAGRQCCGGIFAAIRARILRIGSGAIGHDVRAVFVYTGHGTTGAGGGARARAARAALTAAAAAAARRAGAGIAFRVITAADGENGGGCEQETYEKNASFGHAPMIARFRFGRQVACNAKSITHVHTTIALSSSNS